MRKDILSYLCNQYGLSANGKKQALLDSLVEYFEGCVSFPFSAVIIWTEGAAHGSASAVRS